MWAEQVTAMFTGALATDFSAQEYGRAAAEVLGMLADVDGVRAHTRRVAKRLFNVRGVGVGRYARLYDTVYR